MWWLVALTCPSRAPRSGHGPRSYSFARIPPTATRVRAFRFLLAHSDSSVRLGLQLAHTFGGAANKGALEYASALYTLYTHSAGGPLY